MATFHTAPQPTRLAALVACGALLFAPAVASAQHGIAMLGEPQLPDRRPPAYANPNAPRGGTLHLAVHGTYDSLNPFAVRGTAPSDLRLYMFESLMQRHYDEPFSLYRQLARRVVREPAINALRFVLDPRAKFSDGAPVTTRDIAFSWASLRDNGRPNHRLYYSKVAKIEVLGQHEIRFHLKPAASSDRELPLILGLMPILPAHVYAGRPLDAPSLQKPIGSGPYVLEESDTGRRLVLQRNPDYWGDALPFNRGRFNFERIVYDYYRDQASAFAAFTSGDVDFWREQDALRWSQNLARAALRSKNLTRNAIPLALPSGLQAFVFNTRRAVFAQAPTRAALARMFDSEGINQLFYANAKAITHSYFGGTQLSAWQRKAEGDELALLEGVTLSEESLRGEFTPPPADMRTRKREALATLQSNGWSLEDGKLRNTQTRAPLAFEILVRRREDERLALTYAAALTTIGVEARVRFVDEVQYHNRLRKFDYDMIIHAWYASLSPGNEQAIYWGSSNKDAAGSRNYAGISVPAIDRAISALLASETQKQFTAAARALDRLLMTGNYFVPLFHAPAQWIAWQKDRLTHPRQHSLYGVQLDFWWAP